MSVSFPNSPRIKEQLLSLKKTKYSKRTIINYTSKIMLYKYYNIIIYILILI